MEIHYFPWRIIVPLRQMRGGQHALDCGEGGGIAITTRTMTAMMHKRTSASSPTAAVAATTAIARFPSPKKRRIAGLSRESCRESSDDSAEGGDRWRHRVEDGRTRRISPRAIWTEMPQYFQRWHPISADENHRRHPRAAS